MLPRPVRRDAPPARDALHPGPPEGTSTPRTKSDLPARPPSAGLSGWEDDSPKPGAELLEYLGKVKAAEVACQRSAGWDGEGVGGGDGGGEGGRGPVRSSLVADPHPP
jgi:hypothetical protein